MSEHVNKIKQEIQEIRIKTREELEHFRLAYLSKKGKIPALFSSMGTIAAEHRGAYGKAVNEVKQIAQHIFDSHKSALEADAGKNISALKDISLPAADQHLGLAHPLSQTLDRIKQVFLRLGFSIADGPELEDDFHNFTALNFPPEHPARDMQDTFFVHKNTEDTSQDLVLRTHTSPVQIRLMKQQRPPLRSIMPGRVYRNESITAKSYCLFHQVEGLYIDKNVTLAELKDTLVMFAEMIYGEGVKYRIRPSFFPFTEPSLEMDVWWGDEKTGKWLEILGAGMVHPNVLKAVDIDPEVYTGFAFGMGVERIAMLFYGIDDIRLLYDNDMRFLQQFV